MLGLFKMISLSSSYLATISPISGADDAGSGRTHRTQASGFSRVTGISTGTATRNQLGRLASSGHGMAAEDVQQTNEAFRALSTKFRAAKEALSEFKGQREDHEADLQKLSLNLQQYELALGEAEEFATNKQSEAKKWQGVANQFKDRLTTLSDAVKELEFENANIHK